MIFLAGFVACVALSFLNLPYVLQEGGSIINLCAMIFCLAVALCHLILAVTTRD